MHKIVITAIRNFMRDSSTMVCVDIPAAHYVLKSPDFQYKRFEKSGARSQEPESWNREEEAFIQRFLELFGCKNLRVII
jgi:hypothetical protein